MRISDWSSDVCSSDLSWLRRAEAEQTDEDVRFILLWIGFNAAYAGDVEASRVIAITEGERGLFQAFFATLVGFDGKQIGRATCSKRGWQSVSISVGAVALKKKKQKRKTKQNKA